MPGSEGQQSAIPAVDRDRPNDKHKAVSGKASRRSFLKGAVAGAAVSPAVVGLAARPKVPEGPKVVADLEKYRALGGWVEKPADIQPALDGRVDADVVVIGGGFAGLSTALELAGQGVNVVVVEREFCGFGASGRNAGYLAGAGGLQYDLFLKRVGEQSGRMIVRYYDEAVAYVESKLKEHAIDCDYIQSGIIRAAVHPSQEANIRKVMEIGTRLGHRSEFWDEKEMRARGIPPAFLFGEYDPGGGTLHPGKYVMGLRRAALAAGIRIYENTPMLSYKAGKRVEIRTTKGLATGRAMVFATNAYTPQNGLLEDKVIPIRVSAIETETLSPSQLASLAWPQREGIVTAHYTMESHRLTAHNTLLVTTKRIRYPYGSRTPNVPDYEAYGELRNALHTRFPRLRDVSLAACWSGYISMANDALPVIGVTGDHTNVYYTAGCSGHGVASQSFVGHLLAQRIRGVREPILEGIRHETPTVLPEPLRWCAINGALGAADILDDRVNAKVRAEGQLSP